VNNRTLLSGIRDNHARGCVGDYLRDQVQPGCHMSVVSAFFTVYAYDLMKRELDSIGHMDFLFGEPRFITRLDPDRTEKKAFIIDAKGLRLANVLQQKRVARECADWIRAKVDVRSVRQLNFLHGKMYHVSQNGVDRAIMGSSNFTPAGLGLSSDGGNIELNLVVDSDRDRHDLKAWFDDLWNSSQLTKDVKQEVLQYLAQVYQNHSPEFVYFKTLYEIFKSYLDGADKTDLDLGRTTLFDTEIWRTLFEFQKDGAKGAINKILRHNGCVVADSTGLGKTFLALAVIKYFELKNERVLVLCPKKLRGNWTVYRSNDVLNPFDKDRFRFDVLSHTDLSRESGYSGDINLETLNWANYDLVVIDESHNFRNNLPGRKDEDGNIIRKSRYMRLMEDIIQSGVRTKVLLLSATPVNNDLKDLRNQLYFISAGEDNYFSNSGIPDLKETLRKAQGHFTAWSKLKPEERRVSELLSRLGSDFFKILDGLTIARARKHIQKYYSHEMERLGQFPKRLKPQTESPEIDAKGRFLPYDRLSEEIDQYKLSLFKPSTFLRSDLPKEIMDEYTRRVGNFTQAQREDFLIGMMKVNFLKRLESSVYSFALTMERTIEKIEKLENRLERFLRLQEDFPDLDLSEVHPEDLAGDEDDEVRDALDVGKKLRYKVAHLDVAKWLRALHEDKAQLNLLYIQARDVTPDRDLKLQRIREIISEKVRHPPINRDGMPNPKILIFTAFADTARYLYGHLHEWAMNELGIHSALVVGGGGCQTTYKPKGYSRQEEFDRILCNFSPMAKKRDKIMSMPQVGEIDLLIGTDCISEGQNLQDCDTIVNADIHWNPVRIIQRFGRCDRIGSRNEAIQLINFWPTKNLDNYINLKHRVEGRMALVDVSATQEDNLLQQELEDLITEDLRYRDRQLKRLRDEVLDLEDLDETISLTEFNLDDFRIELLKFLEANRQALEDAPFGLYTVVPSFSDLVTTIQPGVIYCLRQKAKSVDHSSGERINPLQPFYLVYVHNDGNVRLNFVHPKQVLNIYRQLCSDKSVPYDELCALFDQETKDGHDMSHYDRLLQRCIDAIAATFQKRVSTSLQSDRGFLIPEEDNQVDNDEDFELVTWLVIKEAQN
jgi:SNF2 family DNA or RNA helicase